MKTSLLDIRNCDCMDMMKTIEDESQHLIISDPPYYEVKGGFDFIWDSFEDYLQDVELWTKELSRIMAPNGTLFWWGNSKKIAYSQIILDKYLHLENSLIWEKCDSIQYQMYSIEGSRSFNTHNERLLMYSKDYEPGDYAKTGLERVMEEFIIPNHPFAKYLRDEFRLAGVSNKDISKLFPSKTGGLTGCVSNWTNGYNVPTKAQYHKIRDFLNGEYLRQEYEYLRQEYEDLRQEYEDQRQEYEDQRRFFNNTHKTTEVLKFSQQSNITRRHNHPTQKPPLLCRNLIYTCSSKGQNMFIPFIGSGVEAVEGFNHGLNVSGCELDPDYYQAACKRIDRETRQISLF